MSAEKWSSIEVIPDPLCVIFYYKSTETKAGGIEVINQSEWDNIALEQGAILLNKREPFFTREEIIAAREAIAQKGIHIG